MYLYEFTIKILEDTEIRKLFRVLTIIASFNSSQLKAGWSAISRYELKLFSI